MNANYIRRLTLDIKAVALPFLRAGMKDADKFDVGRMLELTTRPPDVLSEVAGMVDFREGDAGLLSRSLHAQEDEDGRRAALNALKCVNSPILESITDFTEAVYPRHQLIRP